MTNTISFDFTKPFLRIRQKGFDISVETSERTVYSKAESLDWIVEEAGLRISFFKENGKNDFQGFIAKSLSLKIESIFLFWLNEAVTRFIGYRAEIEVVVKGTNELISNYEKKYQKQIEVLKISKEAGEEIHLAKLRLLECFYEMNLFSEKELNRLLGANVLIN